MLRYLVILYRRAWQWLNDGLSRDRRSSRIAWWLFFPVAVVMIVFLLVGGLSAWCCYAVYWLVSIALSYVSMAAVILIAAFLRMLNALWRMTRRARVICPACYRATPRPAYVCPSCGQIHQDIRPGRLGLFTRPCECGTRLPTLAWRASRLLSAVCQHCRYPLPAHAGVNDVWIPIFGDRSAGKTRFLYAALNSLMQSAEQGGITVSFPDRKSEYQATQGLQEIRSGWDKPRSSIAAPSALTFRLGKGRKTYLVHLFDVGGEYYRARAAPRSEGPRSRPGAGVRPRSVLDPGGSGSVGRPGD